MALFLIILLALGLRLWGINFGLPAILHIDEQAIVYTSFYLTQNWGRPDIFWYGSIWPLIIALFSGCLFLAGRVGGIYSSPDDFLIAYIKNPTAVFLIGRLINVIFSIFTVWFIYIVGKKLYQKRIGLLAALFLAVSTLHVKETHYLKQDVLATFLALVIFYLAFLISQKGQLKHYFLAGLVLGIGLAVKYNFIFSLLLVLVGHGFWELKVRRRPIFSFFNQKLFIFLAVAFIGHFVVNPYVFLDFRLFIEQSADLLRQQMVNPCQISYPTFWYFVFDFLRNGLGDIIWFLAILGVFITFWQMSKSQNLLLVSFPFIYFLLTNFLTNMPTSRYMMITLPYAVLLAALAAETVREKLFPKNNFFIRLVFLLLTVICIWQPLSRSIKFDKMITSPQTGELATLWIEDNIFPGARIAIEPMLRPYYLANAGPYIYPAQELLDEEIAKIKPGLSTGRFVKAFKKATKDKVGYYIIATPQILVRYDPDINLSERLSNLSYYQNRGVDYIITSSWAKLCQDDSETFMKVNSQDYKLIKQFSPTIEFSFEPHAVYLDYQALDKINIFQKNLIFGPKLSIYQKK